MTKRVLHFIDGELTEGTSGKTFENRNPVDGSLIGEVCEGGEAEVAAAVEAARRAMNGPWGRMPLAERAELLHRVAAGVNARFDEFLEAEVADTGKPVSLASKIDIPRGAANFEIFADLVKSVPTESFQQPTPDGLGALNYAVRVPKGVIGVICPWNLPLLLMTWKVGPALACGNAVVVKPSEETPTTTTLLGEVMAEVGVPRGVFNVVHGFGPGSAGEALTKNRGVDAITFTGETRTGTAIMKTAAEGVRDVSFELGGKNPGIIFADCDLEAAVATASKSVFANCGQVCLGTERIYVERPVFDEFVEKLARAGAAMQLGEPHDEATSMGPLISAQHRDKVLSYYEKAKAEGATVHTGGGAPDMPGDLANGYWVQPTIWTGLSDDSPVVREEIFGPCAHIAPFDDEEEVIARANDTEYGLAAMLWTGDLSRAHRVAPRLEAGLIWVNSWFLRDLRTPFGGMKSSGIGREGGVHSLEFYSELKNVCIKL